MERLQDTPIAVTAVSEAQIRSLALTSSWDLQRIAPSLGFALGGSTKGFNFIIRGISTFVNADGIEQSVGVAIDGIPMARPAGSIADLVDIERVEILEGPQGMLFGKNASAGLVNIITNRPKMQETSVTGRLSYGTYNEVNANGTVNLAVGDTLALRGTVWRFRHDGFVNSPNRQRDIGEKNTGGVRLRLRWQPTSKLDVNIFAERTTANQDPVVSTIRLITNPTTSGLAAYEASQGIVPGPTNNTTSSAHTLYNKGNAKALVGEVAYDLGGPTLTATASYRNIYVLDKFDAPTTGSPVIVQDQFDSVRVKQKSFETRLNSGPNSRLKYVVGGIYFTYKFADLLNINVLPFISVNALSRERVNHYAVFGELTYPILDNLRVIAGARQSWDRITANFDRTIALPVTSFPALNGPGAPFGPFSVTPRTKDSEISYRGGLQFDATPDVMIYTTVSRGYKAAGVDFTTNLSQTIYNARQALVKPEIAMNYELGVRSQFFDRRLTVNATVWHEVFSDFQASARIPTILNGFATQNAKQLKSDGASLDVSLRLPGSITLSNSAAYTHARFTDFKDAPCAATPAASLRPCVGGVQTLDGYPIGNAPKWKNNATIRYDGDGILRDNWHVFGQVNIRTQSKEVFNLAADRNERQGGYSVVNLNVGFGPSDNKWQLSFYGANVFDKRFVARTTPQSSGLYYVNFLPYDARARWGVALDFSL